MSIDDLVEKFVVSGTLNGQERHFLRSQLTKQKLEHLATRPDARGKLSKTLFKLSNYLYCTPALTNEKRSALPISTATLMTTKSRQKSDGTTVSGGGFNGTGKRR